MEQLLVFMLQTVGTEAESKSYLTSILFLIGSLFGLFFYYTSEINTNTPIKPNIT